MANPDNVYTDSIEPPDRLSRATGPMDESHESDWREPVYSYKKSSHYFRSIFRSFLG